MNSCIYQGQVSHKRHHPVKHALNYPVYYYYLDLAELSEIDRQSKVFGYNRKRMVSIWDKDYLKNYQGSLSQRVQSYLKEQGIDLVGGKTFLLTTARVLGRTFNPVSFYYCFNAEGILKAQIAEVSNTFKETHLYFIQADGQRIQKQFYVSPFISFKPSYEFYFKVPNHTFQVKIDEFEDNQKVLEAVLSGKHRELNDHTIWAFLIKFPLMTFKILPQIHWHAIKLYFKGAPMFAHKGAGQTKVMMSFRERLMQKILYRLVNGFKDISIQIEYRDGGIDQLGNVQAVNQYHVKINHPRFFKRMMSFNDVSLGESYMDGDFECDQLHELIVFFLKRVHALKIPHWVKQLGKLKGYWDYLLHFLPRKNHVSGSKKNISEHYDLNNQFFKLWLDESMAYSAAFFKSPSDSLHQGQLNKFEQLCQKLHLKKSDYLLEIGSGWGGFAIYAASHYGCQVKSITISEEQLKYARDKAKALGLEDKIEFQLCDYRQCQGLFDKIVSIEMLEAVGHQYFGQYFKACERLLKPGGAIAIQVITGPDQTFEAYKRRCDFIQKYIFPGGVLPTIYEISKTIKNSTNLVMVSMEDIARHYAQTLKLWRQTFMTKKSEIKNLGFDERFIRMWEFYFCYCEAPFEIGYLGDLQLVLTHRGADKGAYLGEAS